VQQTGLAEWIGSALSGLSAWPVLFVALAVSTVVIFLTELTSNTATAAAFLPVVAAIATGMGADPLQLAVPTALAASCAFMMPVATPPNAIVYGSGRITIPQMARAGLLLNIISVAVITAVVFGLVPYILPTTGAR
jgi:sodium-dependent dicarboxylate transporter 2/3/5